MPIRVGCSKWNVVAALEDEVVPAGTVGFASF